MPIYWQNSGRHFLSNSYTNRIENIDTDWRDENINTKRAVLQKHTIQSMERISISRLLEKVPIDT